MKIWVLLLNGFILIFLQNVICHNYIYAKFYKCPDESVHILYIKSETQGNVISDENNAFKIYNDSEKHSYSNIKFGFRVEYNFLFDKVYRNSGGYTSEFECSSGIVPSTVYLNLGINLSEFYSLDFRPGLCLNIFTSDDDEIYTGFEFNTILIRKIKETFFVFGGFNLHKNFGSAHGVLTYNEINDDFHFQAGIGLGIVHPVFNQFSFDIGIFKEFNTDYGYSGVYSNSKFIKYTKKISYLIKMGINFVL
jgi:hypothetical protein